MRETENKIDKLTINEYRKHNKENPVNKENQVFWWGVIIFATILLISALVK